MNKLVLCALIAAACSPPPAPPPSAEALAGEPMPEQWGLRYEKQYAEWKQAGAAEERTERSVDEPRLAQVLAGSPFAVSYHYPRAHNRSLDDVRESARISERTTATCLACKSASYTTLVAAEDERTVAQKPFSQVAEATLAPVACADCHDPVALDAGEPLRLTRAALVRVQSAAEAAPQEGLKSLVCAQCHSEYYVDPTTKIAEHPWSRGLRIDDMIAFYDAAAFSDFVHPLSGAPLIKLNHPDYELWLQGEHGGSRVTCPSCHMPRDKGITSHSLASPLTRVEATCQRCHAKKTAELAAADVANAQARVGEHLARVIDKLDRGHALVGGWLATDGVSARVEQGRTTLRHAQARWDFIASDASRGFHAPAEATRVLDDAEKALDALLGATP